MKEFAVYSLARLGLLAAAIVVFGGLWLLLGYAASGFWIPLLVAVVASAVASYYLLQGPRSRFAAKVEERARRATRRFEEARAKEDED